MRQFSILVVFALAFGCAAVLYEQESRKVKGVLGQITDLQAKVGDMQAEINRLNGELEAIKLAERRRPHLNTIASRVLNDEPAPAAATRPVERAAAKPESRSGFVAGDVTPSAPAIKSHGDEEDSEWTKPTVDAEVYQAQSGNSGESAVADPYQ